MNNTGSNITCASTEQQNNFFKTYDFQARFVNKYFDFNDFENPIKSFIDDRMFFPIQPFQMKSNIVYVKRSFTQLSDSLFPFAEVKNYTFLSVENIKAFTSSTDYYGTHCLAFVLFRIDFDYDIYTRQIYSTSDLLSDLGGILSALFAIGALIVSIVAEKLFYSQIISDIYQTMPSTRDKDKKDNL